jgi:site-specific recombinase XerD
VRRPLDRIRPADVERYLPDKIASGLAPTTGVHHVTFLGGLFRFAIKRGWASSNPVALVDRPRLRANQVGACGSYNLRSSRRCSIPMADRLAGGLDRHFHASIWQADEDLVFCHPYTGRPYDASKLRKRFDAALKRAELRRITFHGLRHTFGTQMAAAGAPPRAAGRAQR